MSLAGSYANTVDAAFSFVVCQWSSLEVLSIGVCCLPLQMLKSTIEFA